MVACNSFVYRPKKILISDEYYKKELNIVRFIVVENGYNSMILDKINIKNKKSKASTVTTADM